MAMILQKKKIDGHDKVFFVIYSKYLLLERVCKDFYQLCVELLNMKDQYLKNDSNEKVKVNKSIYINFGVFNREFHDIIFFHPFLFLL